MRQEGWGGEVGPEADQGGQGKEEDGCGRHCRQKWGGGGGGEEDNSRQEAAWHQEAGVLRWEAEPASRGQEAEASMQQPTGKWETTPAAAAAMATATVCPKL